jgi:TIR domain
MRANGVAMHDDELFAHLVLEALKHGARVELDGLGVFQRDGENNYSFERKSTPKVFIAYAHEDAVAAERLFDGFTASGFDPWMDRRKLLPGQNWPRAIQYALETSDFVVTCFSSNSVAKKGGFQAEIRYALDCGSRLPLDDVYLIPVRLDECRVPARIQREVQWVDLFPTWKRGFQRMLKIMREKSKG